MLERARTAAPQGIDGETKLMGLLGESIAYTKSPPMHNVAALTLGINAVYLPLPLPAAAVAGFLEAAWALGALGFNVTTPHKGLVAGIVPAAAGALVSVNTLYRGPQGWLAASTDGEGFARGLARLGPRLEEFTEVVLLGAGGASSAVLQRIVAARPPQGPRLAVFRRRPDGDEALRQALPTGAALTFHDLDAGALARALAGKGAETLFIQATSAPQRGDDLQALVPCLRDFRGVFVDLVYGKPSALLGAARRQGLAAQDGEAMLIEQARLSQEHWWGRAAGYDAMTAALRGE